MSKLVVIILVVTAFFAGKFFASSSNSSYAHTEEVTSLSDLADIKDHDAQRRAFMKLWKNQAQEFERNKAKIERDIAEIERKRSEIEERINSRAQ